MEEKAGRRRTTPCNSRTKSGIGTTRLRGKNVLAVAKLTKKPHFEGRLWIKNGAVDYCSRRLSLKDFSATCILVRNTGIITNRTGRWILWVGLWVARLKLNYSFKRTRTRLVNTCHYLTTQSTSC